ncbi:DUF4407 domain-containing protein [Streptacidiphilus jiangxiensis]|nr:DUF4407 domain-containing protein [Streptacidiphilus jiangxiensis]
MDEDLLRVVRYERSRHTALGAVMVGTATIAGFSMWNFVNEALGRASIVALVPAVLWAVFVLLLDRWMIAPQAQSRRRVAPVLLRLTVSLLIGAVVAEPLVLRVFQTAIEQNVEQGRQQALDHLRSELLRCNPDPSQGNVSAPSECAPGGYLLSFAATPSGQQGELSTLRSQAAVLQRQVTQEQDRLSSIDDQVRSECAKQIPIAGTRLWQRSSECLRLRIVADDYRATHDITADASQLTTLNNRISTLSGSLASSQSSFTISRSRLISQRMAEAASAQGPIGALERMSALDSLANGNAVLFIGVWLIRLLFVVIDVLPVLVKFLSGATSYDRLLTERSHSAIRIDVEHTRTEERKAMAREEIERAETEQWVRHRKAELDASRREHIAAMNIRVTRAVNELEAELTRVGSGG